MIEDTCHCEITTETSQGVLLVWGGLGMAVVTEPYRNPAMPTMHLGACGAT